jgi:hypothetical protein
MRNFMRVANLMVAPPLDSVRGESRSGGSSSSFSSRPSALYGDVERVPAFAAGAAMAAVAVAAVAVRRGG